MASAKSDIRDRLKAAGLWGAFVARRDGLKSEGLGPVVSRNQAFSEIEPQLIRWEAEQAKPLGESVADTSCHADQPDARPKSGVDSSIFEGKEEASIVAVIQWVARNLEVDDPRPEDAPSAEAWGMLLSYRRTSLRKDEFWDKVFVKLIPNRAQLETEPKGALDDAGLSVVIDQLLALGRTAREES